MSEQFNHIILCFFYYTQDVYSIPSRLTDIFTDKLKWLKVHTWLRTHIADFDLLQKPKLGQEGPGIYVEITRKKWFSS